MKYRKGNLYIERSNSCLGMYKCIFETSHKVYEGYTDDSMVYDWFNTDDTNLYWSGVTSTITESRELVHKAWRMAYSIAREGMRRNYNI